MSGREGRAINVYSQVKEDRVRREERPRMYAGHGCQCRDETERRGGCSPGDGETRDCMGCRQDEAIEAELKTGQRVSNARGR